MNNNLVIVIAGPTSSGKSSLAIDLAKNVNGVVINCDAMQIYKDIPIIAATPSINDKKMVEHRLYEIYDCSKRGNVVEWLDLCVREIKDLWKNNMVPIVVGGTGMYIDALINGVTPIPEVDECVRQEVQSLFKEKGLGFLYNYLTSIDAEMAQRLSENDKTRIIRAVEIYKATGKKLSDWYKVPMIKKIPEAKFLVVKIVPDLDDIEKRCKIRLDKMVNELGVLKEIELLVRKNLSADLPAMKALGVPELRKFVDGELSLNEALDLAKLHTRQYAKRQRTWLKNKLVADITFDKAYDGQDNYLQQIVNTINW